MSQRARETHSQLPRGLPRGSLLPLKAGGPWCCTLALPGFLPRSLPSKSCAQGSLFWACAPERNLAAFMNVYVCKHVCVHAVCGYIIGLYVMCVYRYYLRVCIYMYYMGVYVYMYV